ncbi:MAG: endonuclease/exonuclease/phosphatase [Lachnospiraceae bacterium]|nr:endonuclease/exonuclease/phosphatase [Lachnospiraceae bacterium]
MKLLFWNTHKNKNINEYVSNLVAENEIDILILAEYSGNITELDSILAKSQKRLKRCNTIGSDRIKIWSNYLDVQPGIQEKHYSLQIINNEYIVCGVHLFSNLNGERNDERVLLANRIMDEISKLKQKIKTDKVIILGDINESPYEKTSLSALGFHGMPSLNVSDDKTRVVSGVEYEKMYNPMWNLYGDFEYPPGTYYRSESNLCTAAWYMIDQIIISQSMIGLLNRNDLKIIVECMGNSLYTENKHPNKRISDHFPIMCGFNIM